MHVPLETIPYNKIFLISDIHFGVRANSTEWLDNQIEFFEKVYFPLLEEKVEKGDILFVMGDWFDNRQLLDINIMNKSIGIVHKLSTILPVYFITGNHDIYKKKDTDVNSLVAFKYIPNVKIFEKPVIITNGSNQILILPWIGDINREEEIINSHPCDYVFAHTDIAGFKYDNGRNINKGIKPKVIKGIKRLFSGHIHKRQEYKNFIYIGSPYSTKRGDIGNKKGVYIFQPDSNRLEFVANRYSPIFQKINLEELLEWTLEKTHKVLENNYTDIIVPDKYIRLFNLTQFIELLEGCLYKKIETGGERKRLDEFSNEFFEEENIKDIVSLLEASLESASLDKETLEALKILNREYYDRAAKEENEIL